MLNKEQYLRLRRNRNQKDIKGYYSVSTAEESIPHYAANRSLLVKLSLRVQLLDIRFHKKFQGLEICLNIYFRIEIISISLMNFILLFSFVIVRINSQNTITISREFFPGNANIVGWTQFTPYFTLMRIYNCLGQPVLCGFTNTIVQKTYTNLPPHHKIKFSFTFWMLDSWDSVNESDKVDLYFDGELYMTIKKDYFEGTFICANSVWPDIPLEIVYEQPHNIPTFNVKMIGQFGQWEVPDPTQLYIDEQYGFTNVVLEVFSCIDECDACEFVDF